MFLMENKTSLRGERRINKGGIFVWCGDETGYFSLVQVGCRGFFSSL